jgi:mono/diheme cytochrome c family protein
MNLGMGSHVDRGQLGRTPARPMRPLRLVPLTLAGLSAVVPYVAVVYARAPQAATASGPDFVREVQPILGVACVRCHGAEETLGFLRLDTKEGFLEGGRSGPAVVAGDPEASALVTRLVHPDPMKRMPLEADPLSPAEIETLRRWVKAGASWPEGVTITVAAVPAPPPVMAVKRDASHLSFNRDVRPILSDNCFACHGPDRSQRQRGLRLDREDGAKAPLPSGRVAIVSGKPEVSELIRRVLDPAEERRMPHVSSGKPRLTAAQIETLRRWIAEGASWEPHWAYIPPTRAAPPLVKRADWPRGPVDRFILAGIEGQGLAPSPAASPCELLRRLSFDLTGLPPTPEEARRFEADRRPGAYERQVDRLLASPRFGERMALFWLDLVRYSDTVGYYSDVPRPMWRYRDWVVAAFNRNLPFDRFTADQLAGDLAPDAGFDQRIASGYNRLLQTTDETGADPKEYRAIYLADRVRNLSSVWLGATVGCAQCHDHKFDPYQAKDFYSLGAFFADVKEIPVGERELEYLPDPAQELRIDAAEAEIKGLREAFEAVTPERAAAQAAWEKAFLARRSPRFTTLEPIEAGSENGTRVMIEQFTQSLLASTSHGPKPPRDTYTVRFTTALEGITALRLEALLSYPEDTLPLGGPGRDANGGFLVSEMEVRDAGGRRLPLRNASSSLTDDPLGSMGAARAIDGRADTGWGLAAADGESHRLVVELAEPLGAGAETTITLTLRQNAGSLRTLGRFALSATTEPLPVRAEPGPEANKEVLAALSLDPAQRTKEQSKEVAAFWRSAAPELAALRASLRAAEVRRRALLAPVPSSYVTTVQPPDEVRILPRGDWRHESGDVVGPAVPQFLPPLVTSERRATRADLARWLTTKENPLTARVFVNRLWKLYFGHGLSRSVEDLGAQGEWPTHPELLDWLAVEFVESEWDVKHVVRMLVTSSTYRQASTVPKLLLEKDPYNRLYARQSRVRLDAEAVRDNALFVAGLLSMKMGGPSVHPYQPPGFWAHLSFPPREWDSSLGEDQYRRGLYTWWQRTFPHPSLAAFDAPNREECVAERFRSNVPQQALVLLNDPTYVEAARTFAARILREGGASFDSRLRFAYSRALQREPTANDARVLYALLRQEQVEFGHDPAAARKFVAVGQAATAGDLSPVELAAWTQVARAILNLPELITRP